MKTVTGAFLILIGLTFLHPALTLIAIGAILIAADK